MGGGSKKVTVGHWLKCYLHLVVSAPIDKLHQMIYGERTMFKGTVSSSRTIYINKLELFGGDKADGGVQGSVQLLFGGESQGRSGQIQRFLGNNVPAFRGFFSLFFIDFTWSFIMPQLKPIWLRVEHLYADWDDEVWYPEKLSIKRLKGVVSKYAITVTWMPIQEPSEQTISYKIQYRIANSGDDFEDLVTGDFAGGEAPADLTGAKTTPNNIYQPITITDISSTSAIGYLTDGVFSTKNNGTIPSGSRTHNENLDQDAYEFVVVKLSGDGDVIISSVVDSVPTYQDINPVHMLYHICTQRRWNVRWPTSLIDEDSWQACADILFDEKFGLSAGIRSESGQDLQQKILDVINAYLKPNFVTNKIELHLMRDNYSLDDLTELNQSNSQLVSYSMALDSSDLVNTVTVNYTDDNGDIKTVTENNLAAIQLSGGVVASVQDYPWVKSPRIAKILAKRDVRLSSSPLAKMKRITNRVLWNHVKGDVVKVADDTLGIVSAAFRIADIKETENGEFEVDLIQDVFGLSSSTYDLEDDLQEQYDPTQLQPVSEFVLLELPYWIVYFSLSEAERNALPEDYAFVGSLATHNYNGGFTYRYDLLQSFSEETNYTDIADGDYTPTGYLAASISKTATSFEVVSAVDLFVENFDVTGAVIGLIQSAAGEELISIETYNETELSFTVKRGVLDTVPLQHASGALLMILTSAAAQDTTTRLAGDLLYYKAMPVGNGAALDFEDASAEEITLFSRASRPYPPGQFKLNDEYYPDMVFGDVVVSWAHRDRLLQTVALVGYDEDSIGPEADTTYRITVYEGVGTGGTVLVTYGGLTGTSHTLINDDIAGAQIITVTLESVRDGYESWTMHEHTVERGGLGFGLGEYLGGA